MSDKDKPSTIATPPTSPGGLPPTKQSPRQSNDHPTIPPPPPPPPTEAIPLGLGPDGKSLLPKLGPDGQPLKGPPLDKDGKPLPPPPIIGPDGRELPRPKDANGRPLPIYVSPEGKPVLDKEGNPIALRFNKEGKPIPLEMEYPDDIAPEGPHPPGTSGGGQNVGQKADKIPDCVFYAGIVDIVASLIVSAVTIYFMAMAHEAGHPIWNFLAGSVVMSVVGAACGALPMIASKKNSFNFLWIWLGTATTCLLIELGLLFSAPAVTQGGIISSAFCGIRLVYSVCTTCIFANTDNQTGQGQLAQYNQQSYNPAVSPYPKEDTGYYHYNQQQQQQQQQQIPRTQSTMVLQQQPSMVIQQPVVVQQPIMSYGYGYPMMGGYGYGYPMMGAGYGYGFGAGYGWGGGCHHGYCPYYDWGWGYSGGLDGWW